MWHLLTEPPFDYTYRFSFVITRFVISLYEHRIAYTSSTPIPCPCTSVYSAHRNNLQ